MIFLLTKFNMLNGRSITVSKEKSASSVKNVIGSKLNLSLPVVQDFPNWRSFTKKVSIQNSYILNESRNALWTQCFSLVECNV